MQQELDGKIQSLEGFIAIKQSSLAKMIADYNNALAIAKTDWETKQHTLQNEQNILDEFDIKFPLETYIENLLKIETLNSEITDLKIQQRQSIGKGYEPDAVNETSRINNLIKEKSTLLNQLQAQNDSYKSNRSILNIFDRRRQIEILTKEIAYLSLDPTKVDTTAGKTGEKLIKEKTKIIKQLENENNNSEKKLEGKYSEKRKQYFQKLQNTYNAIESAYKAKKRLDSGIKNFYTKEIKKIQDEINNYEKQKQAQVDKHAKNLQTEQLKFEQRVGIYSPLSIKFEEFLLATQLQSSDVINHVNPLAPSIITRKNVEKTIVPYLENLLQTFEQPVREEKLKQLKIILDQMFNTHEALLNIGADYNSSDIFNFHKNRDEQLKNLFNWGDERPTNTLLRDSIKRLYDLEIGLIETAYQQAKHHYYQDYFNKRYSEDYKLSLASIKDVTSITLEERPIFDNDTDKAINYIIKQQESLDNELTQITTHKNQSRQTSEFSAFELDYQISLIKKYQLHNFINLTQVVNEVVNERIDNLNKLVKIEFNKILNDTSLDQNEKMKQLTDINQKYLTTLTELRGNLDMAGRFVENKLRSPADDQLLGQDNLNKLRNILLEGQAKLLVADNNLTVQLQIVDKLTLNTQAKVVESTTAEIKNNTPINYHTEFISIVSKIHEALKERDAGITENFTDRIKLEKLNATFGKKINEYQQRFEQVSELFRKDKHISESTRPETEAFIKRVSDELNRASQFTNNYKRSTSSHITPPAQVPVNTSLKKTF